jgi:hypothetical protein
MHTKNASVLDLVFPELRGEDRKQLSYRCLVTRTRAGPYCAALVPALTCGRHRAILGIGEGTKRQREERFSVNAD